MNQEDNFYWKMLKNFNIMENKKNKLFEEHLRKIKYRVDYKINESPKYRSLVNNNEEFDNLPVEIYNTDDGQSVPASPAFTNEAGEQEDAQKPEGNKLAEPSNNDQPLDDKSLPDVNTDIKKPANPAKEVIGGDINTPVDNDTNVPIKPVDDIQNDIIKHNIAAMQSIHDQLEGLNATVQGLNTKLDALNADVEEVREPTNSEKLMSKTNVSYPYYFNLNDFWQGNWFNEKRNGENEKGIRELPDGTFIADFDDLPQQSKIDVQNSFNDYM